MQNDLYKAPLPPHLASDRVAGLREELTDELQEKLLALLGQQTYSEWLDWLRSNREQVASYDLLPKRARLARLQSPQSGLRDAALRLHYACAWLAVVQYRAAQHLPPQGPPLHDGSDQRQAVLQIWGVLDDLTDSEIWPFEGFAAVTTYPFRRDS